MRTVSPAAAAAAACLAASLAACGGAGAGAGSTTSRSRASAVARAHRVRTRLPPYARLLGSASSEQTTPGFVPVASLRSQTVAWVVHVSTGVTLLSFKQPAVALHLHSGTTDAGATGWRYGPDISGSELRHVLAAFNGGFRLNVGDGGFRSGGRTAVPLRAGLGSVVTYSDGSTDIGSWGSEVPAAGRRIASVRQNLPLLIDRGIPATNVGCLVCWGATLGGVTDPARSALGVTADGHLVWAAAEHATVATLAAALRAARVVRAVELDINPEWVAGYLYRHGRGVTPIPVLPGQTGIPGQFLAPWSRDFFTAVVR